MKPYLLLAAVALAAPAASVADPFRASSCAPYHGGYHAFRPYVPHYGYRPSYRYYAPSPGISFYFGSRPATYTATRYYVSDEPSLEADVQRALRREGYYSGPLDGDLGPMSRSAIRDYQNDHGLYPTGRVDSRLLRSLGL